MRWIALLCLITQACASGSASTTREAPRRPRDASAADAASDQHVPDAAPLDADISAPPDATAIDMRPADDMTRDAMALDLDLAIGPDMAGAPDMAELDMAPDPDMARDPDMALEPDMADPGPLPERLLISELDYDQPGNDLADFVELYNAAPTPAVLDAVVVEFINGDPLEVYRAVPLDGVLASGARLVLGQAAIVDDLPPGVRGVLIADGIQNGAPDAIRLMTPDGPLDGLAYEGNLPGFGEGAGPIAADQGLDAGGSLARCPDDADTDDNATDFTLLPTPTPGAANACP